MFGQSDFGSTDVTSFSLSTLSSGGGSEGFVINGAGALSVRNAGDVNADGFGDVIVKATDTAYVVFGKSSFSATIAVSSLSSGGGSDGFAINKVDEEDYGSLSDVSGAGDVNGDGYDDLILGMKDADPQYAQSPYYADSGAAVIVFGKSSFSAEFELSLAGGGGTDGIQFNGVGESDYVGKSVSAAGDVDGDGFDDVIIGAYNSSKATAYILFGQSAFGYGTYDADDIDGSNGFRFDGDDGGGAVSSAGDVNGDGFADAAVGSILEDTFNGYYYYETGAAYIIFGDGFNFSLNEGTGSYNFYQGTNYDNSYDGLDGDDYIAGGGGGDNVLIGGLGNDTILGHDGGGGHDGDDTLIGGQGDDTIRGTGGEDILYGGAGDDVLEVFCACFVRIDGGNGLDTLLINGEDQVLDLTRIPDNRLTSIEIIDLGRPQEGEWQEEDHPGNTVKLTTIEVVNLTKDRVGASIETGNGSNTLVIYGEENDRVVMESGWSMTGTTMYDGTSIDVWEKGNARLYVEDQIAIIATPSLLVSTLGGTTGYTVYGDDAGDEFGFSVSTAGDVNGDGYDDFIIGAPDSEIRGLDLGRAFVAFGQSGGLPSTLMFDGSDGFVINGFRHFGKYTDCDTGNGEGDVTPVTTYSLGWTVAEVGDINGDGFDDLIVGTPYSQYYYQYSEAYSEGRAFVVFGRSDFESSVEPETFIVNVRNEVVIDGFQVLNHGNGFAGHLAEAVHGGGDFDGDGFDDLVVAQSRDAEISGADNTSAFLVFGRSEWTEDVDTGDTGEQRVWFIGESFEYDQAEYFSSMKFAGDINGDGFDDIVLGGPKGGMGDYYYPSYDEGIVYVIFGMSRTDPEAL